jgi:hypothetical protein
VRLLGNSGHENTKLGAGGFLDNVFTISSS